MSGKTERSWNEFSNFAFTGTEIRPIAVVERELEQKIAAWNDRQESSHPNGLRHE
jgi:hypothetical protein